MGAFYENLVVLDAVEDDVIKALGRAQALVAPATNGAVVVFHDEDVKMDRLAAPLSAALDRTVLGFAVHDSDILCCMVWRDGRSVSEVAVPDPAEYFGFDPSQLDGPGSEAVVSRSAALGLEGFIGAVAPEQAQEIRQVLTRHYVFAEERHADLLQLLGLPAFSAGWGRSYLLSEAREAFAGPELRATP